jgi:RNA polymerase sigma-70 factor (ECF subfamily)
MRMIAVAERGEGSADAVLVRRAQRGDRAAFELLVAPRLDRCYRLAWSILSNEADAADAMQDGLLSAWREVPRLRDPAAFDGWLNRVVANAARMARRGRMRRREVQVRPASVGDGDAPLTLPTIDAGAAAEIEHVVDADLVGRALARLRPEDRAILTLFYVDERSMQEIAHTLRMPVGTAKWRLHEARKSLERVMGADA